MNERGFRLDEPETMPARRLLPVFTLEEINKFLKRARDSSFICFSPENYERGLEIDDKTPARCEDCDLYVSIPSKGICVAHLLNIKLRKPWENARYLVLDKS